MRFGIKYLQPNIYVLRILNYFLFLFNDSVIEDVWHSRVSLATVTTRRRNNTSRPALPDDVLNARLTLIGLSWPRPFIGTSLTAGVSDEKCLLMCFTSIRCLVYDTHRQSPVLNLPIPTISTRLVTWRRCSRWQRWHTRRINVGN